MAPFIKVAQVLVYYFLSISSTNVFIFPIKLHYDQILFMKGKASVLEIYLPLSHCVLLLPQFLDYFSGFLALVF